MPDINALELNAYHSPCSKCHRYDIVIKQEAIGDVAYKSVCQSCGYTKYFDRRNRVIYEEDQETLTPEDI